MNIVQRHEYLRVKANHLEILVESLYPEFKGWKHNFNDFKGFFIKVDVKPFSDSDSQFIEFVRLNYGSHKMGMTDYILRKLCQDGHIPPGDYHIDE